MRETYERFSQAGLPFVAPYAEMEEAGYVMFRVADPDGHVIENYNDPSLRPPG